MGISACNTVIETFGEELFVRVLSLLPFVNASLYSSKLATTEIIATEEYHYIYMHRHSITLVTHSFLSLTKCLTKEWAMSKTEGFPIRRRSCESLSSCLLNCRKRYNIIYCYIYSFMIIIYILFILLSRLQISVSCSFFL